jgi:hypothetical protein
MSPETGTDPGPAATQHGSVLGQRSGEHCGVGETSQSLETSLADGPDMDERHIDRHGSVSSHSFDTTDRDHMLTRSDELLGDEANIKRLIQPGEKAFGHIQPQTANNRGMIE